MVQNQEDFEGVVQDMYFMPELDDVVEGGSGHMPRY